MEKKIYMSGSFMDLQFIAQHQSNGEWKCIPQYSGGNGTVMTNDGEPLRSIKSLKYHDTLEEARCPAKKARMVDNARREDLSIIAGRPRIYN